MANDTISDMLTRIRNAQLARHSEVTILNTINNLKITEILFKEGFIKNYAQTQKKIFVKNSNSKQKFTEITIQLKYLTHLQKPCISTLKRLSSPGLRRYTNYKNMPNVLNGMGIIILTTSQGIMTDKEAKQKKVGGELLCCIC